MEAASFKDIFQQEEASHCSGGTSLPPAALPHSGSYRWRICRIQKI
ncbi:hypothetical protein Nmel_015575 [Mimus melanotis]